MQTVTLRITMRNNSDARNCQSVLRGLPGKTSISAIRHNGGKVVFAEVDHGTETCTWLDAQHSVLAFEVVS